MYMYMFMYLYGRICIHQYVCAQTHKLIDSGFGTYYPIIKQRISGFGPAWLEGCWINVARVNSHAEDGRIATSPNVGGAGRNLQAKAVPSSGLPPGVA